MFIEPAIKGERRGWIEVICGSMFSGKTEELIRRVKRAKIANLRVEIFKPAMDIRFHRENIVSHDESSLRAKPVGQPGMIPGLATGADVIAIDEAQFFDDSLVQICDELALKGARVIIAGLDMDYTGNPFGPVPSLLSKAEYITKLHAICVKCGNIASYSYRKSIDDSKILLGEKELYEPRCRLCFSKGENI